MLAIFFLLIYNESPSLLYWTSNTSLLQLNLLLVLPKKCSVNNAKIKTDRIRMCRFLRLYYVITYGRFLNYKDTDLNLVPGQISKQVSCSSETSLSICSRSPQEHTPYIVPRCPYKLYLLLNEDRNLRGQCHRKVPITALKAW